MNAPAFTRVLLAVALALSSARVFADDKAGTDIGQLLTGALATRFSETVQSDPTPEILPNHHRYYRFIVFGVEVGPGGSILSRQAFQEEKQSFANAQNELTKLTPRQQLLAALLLGDAESRFPAIGARASYGGGLGKGHGLRFTTADEKFDIKIEDGTYSCRILEFAKRLNELYEQANKH